MECMGPKARAPEAFSALAGQSRGVARRAKVSPVVCAGPGNRVLASKDTADGLCGVTALLSHLKGRKGTYYFGRHGF